MALKPLADGFIARATLWRQDAFRLRGPGADELDAMERILEGF